MPKVHANSFADMVKALKQLRPQNERTAQYIAALLGYQTIETTQQKPPGIEKPAPPPMPTHPETTPATKTIVKKRRKALASELVHEQDEATSAPAWLHSAPPIAEAPDVKIPLSLQPLFNSCWTRAIISGTLSTPAYSGEINISEIIQRIARAEPINHVPRQMVSTLSHGAQILVDLSTALEPFTRDQTWLARAIIQVVGHDKTVVRAFEGLPLWGIGTGPRDEWTEYTPPVTGVPVLVITDLGIGRTISSERAAPQDWQQFATRLYQAGCPLVAFVPYPKHRWPKPLTRVMTIIQWDRITTARTVRRDVGSALRVPGTAL